MEPAVALRRRVFWMSSSIVVVGGIVMACSGSSTDTFSNPPDAGTAEDATEEEEAVTPVDAGGGACKLPDGISTGRQACDDCLLKRCCQAIVSCYDDPKCEAMNECLTTCRKKFGTASDAGADCARTCAEKDNATAEKLLDMLDCQSTRCGSDCKG